MIRSGPSTMYSPTGTSDSSGFSERDSGFSNGCSNTAGNQPPPFRSAFPGFQRSESPNIADRMRTGSPGINFEPVFLKVLLIFATQWKHGIHEITNLTETKQI